MVKVKAEGLRERLRSGAEADIWYDADDHGDTHVASRIEDVQAAMNEAGEMMPRIAVVLRAMRDAVPERAVDAAILAEVDQLLKALEAPVLHIKVAYHPDHSGGEGADFDGEARQILIAEHEIDLDVDGSVENAFERVTGLRPSSIVAVDRENAWTEDGHPEPLHAATEITPGGMG